MTTLTMKAIRPVRNLEDQVREDIQSAIEGWRMTGDPEYCRQADEILEMFERTSLARDLDARLGFLD